MNGEKGTANQAPPAHADGQARPTLVVVMGVAGAGKTTVGRALASACGWAFEDADDYHSSASIASMRDGVPLTDRDRAPWLAGLRALLGRYRASRTPMVLACSALREAYRIALLPEGASAGELLFVQLDVSAALARQRIEARSGHYMPPALIESQFAVLEEPVGALRLDAGRPVVELVSRIVEALST